MRACRFSSASPAVCPAKSGSSALRVLVKQVADADDFKANAEVGGKSAAVVDGALRGVGAGHADAEHIFRAERIGGNGGDQCGVDAAAESDEDFAESALADVVTGSEDEGAIGGLGVVFRRIGDRRRVEGIER